MLTQELYKKLKKEIGKKISGAFTYDGNVIKWEYDGYESMYDDLEIHLDDIYYEDKEIIEEVLSNYGDFIITEPEIHDTIIYFYIE